MLSCVCFLAGPADPVLFGVPLASMSPPLFTALIYCAYGPVPYVVFWSSVSFDRYFFRFLSDVGPNPLFRPACCLTFFFPLLLTSPDVSILPSASFQVWALVFFVSAPSDGFTSFSFVVDFFMSRRSIFFSPPYYSHLLPRVYRFCSPSPLWVFWVRFPSPFRLNTRFFNVRSCVLFAISPRFQFCLSFI